MRPTPLHPVRRRLIASLALALGTALGVTLLTVPAGTAAPAQRVASDQPLPGYTISNPPLAPLTVRGRTTRVFQGVHQHAAYDVEVPARWNGELVMWAHGFRGATRVLTVDPPDYGLRRRLLAQGYAWAASSYARNDYDVRTGVETTRGLAQRAARLLGRTPKRTYVAGVSMGGHVIGRSLEQYPGFYDGALPMCGVMGDQRLFDYFLGYNLVAQDLADVAAYPPPADYLRNAVPRIQQTLGLVGTTPQQPAIGDPRGEQLRAVTTELSGGPRPGSDRAFAVWKDFLFTVYSPDNGGSLAQNPGRVASNLGVSYTPDSPVDVDTTVRRVGASDDFSRTTRALTQVPRIEGRPRVPTLTLHGLGDLFVPFSMEQDYLRDVRRQGQRRFLVQRAIRAAGHCEFTDREVGRAWDDLVRWVERGPRARPAGDRVLPRRAVARASYGCRFTDPRGYDEPARYATRGLYARC